MWIVPAEEESVSTSLAIITLVPEVETIEPTVLARIQAAPDTLFTLDTVRALMCKVPLMLLIGPTSPTR